ncbi:MAG TPA: UDP-N-acetylglucosamine 2-epimerase [Bryobacteraceae bacterium]|nr:UDP-N-acetylglucosamine 2-epimerase [Bryobacteraceae bacterium]
MKSAQRKVAVVLVDRANYGRLKPVMRAIHSHPDLELQVIAAGTMVLERFDLPAKIVAADGFQINSEVFIELEGSNPTTMAKSLGFGVVEFSGEFQRLKPDIVLIIGDRYEALAAAIAAAYMNICIVHIQGGEVSGSIDESARHAISKFAHYHVPSTKRSAEYIIRMGERPDTVLTVGCPSSDIARLLDVTLDDRVVNEPGSGANIDLDQPFLLVVFHPTTTEFGGERAQMNECLVALDALAYPTVLLWPNIDAGSDQISKAIRVFRTEKKPAWLRTLTNLSPENYLRVLAKAACAIGNSSSFVRDAGYFGTPIVLMGGRQTGRESDANVTRVAPLADDIVHATRMQLAHGRYLPSKLYGDGYVSERIANGVAGLTTYSQKRLHYVSEEVAGSTVISNAVPLVGEQNGSAIRSRVSAAAEA